MTQIKSGKKVYSAEKKLTMCHLYCILPSWGSFINYVDTILCIFDHPPTYVDKIFTLEVDKIWTILDHLPTPSCPRSYRMTPNTIANCFLSAV